MRVVPHKIAVTKEILDFIKNYNTICINKNGNEYYKIPYWFKNSGETNGEFTALLELTDDDLILGRDE